MRGRNLEEVDKERGRKDCIAERALVRVLRVLILWKALVKGRINHLQMRLD